MNRKSTLLALLVAAGSLTVAAALWPRDARSQINAAPSWIPMGVSQSGSTSTAWFHEPSSRQGVACQTSAAGSGQAPSSVHCVGFKLP